MNDGDPPGRRSACEGCPIWQHERELLPCDWELVRFYDRVRHQRIQTKDFTDDKGQRHFDSLDLRAVESAMRLHGIPEEDWAELLELVYFLEAIEAGRFDEDLYPASLLHEED